MEESIAKIPKMAATRAAELLDISIQAIHKQLKKDNISLPKVGSKAYLTHEVSKKLFNLHFDKKKFAFQIVKGGTGKTTALFNICCCASVYGAKILCIDIDPQGNLTDSFGISAEESPVLIDIISGTASVEDAIVNVAPGIDLLPSRIENVVLDNKLLLDRKPPHTLFNKILNGIDKQYDFIFIDCPPTMGYSVTAASIYAGMVITPLNPDKYSAKGLKILKEELDKIHREFNTEVSYKVFLNKFSGNTILSDKAISTTISEETENGRALNTAVRQSQEIPNCVDAGLNLFSSLKKSTARDDIDLLTQELLGIDVLAQKAARSRSQVALELE